MDYCLWQRVLLILTLCLQGAGWALAAGDCPPPPVTPTSEQIRNLMRNATDHGYLWRITRDGHASYLYGTIHVARMEWMVPGPSAMQALRASDVLALELDVLDPAIQQRMAAAMEKMRGAQLPKPLALRLQQQIRRACIPEEGAKKLIPELQLALLEMAAGRPDGIDAAYAVDALLAGLGHGAGMNVISLETPEGQLRTLQMEDPRDTVALVERGLAEMESGNVRNLLHRMTKAWSEANLDELAGYRDWCKCVETEAERKLMVRLLDDRNPALAERIAALHAEGKNVFAAVGSLHMTGEIGLPALLEKRGFKVERIGLKP